MFNRTLLLCFVLAESMLSTHACRRPRSLTMAQTEARNERPTPSLSGQAREARRITSFLAAALNLNAMQLRAVEAYTAAERQALALATTPTEAAQAQADYRLAVHRVLDPRQLWAYVELCQQRAGTALALDGTEAAVR